MSENKGLKIKGLGGRLRQWRLKVPLKSFQLAEKLKLSQGSLSDIENEKSLPSAPTIASLMENTDIDIFWLLTGKVDYDPGCEVMEAEPLNTIYVSPGQRILLEGRAL